MAGVPRMKTLSDEGPSLVSKCLEFTKHLANHVQIVDSQPSSKNILCDQCGETFQDSDC